MLDTSNIISNELIGYGIGNKMALRELEGSRILQNVTLDSCCHRQVYWFYIKDNFDFVALITSTVNFMSDA